MAEKKKAKQTSVTRVTAKSDKPAKAAGKKAPQTTSAPTKKKRRLGSARPLQRMFSGIAGYFKGAWSELKQVHWPTRRATWSMTGALLVYTSFFVALILLIDIFFEYLFKLILR